MHRIEKSLERTDPEDLLEEDRHLVEDYTLAELAAATTDTRVMWEESMIEGDGVQKSHPPFPPEPEPGPVVCRG